ncbi:hypothetical protein Tco_1302643 [Tanacetum coccineum]
MLRKGSDFSEESVKKSWWEESANESGSKLIPRFDSSFIENSDCGTKSQSDNTVGSPHGFFIYGMEVLKGNEKVTEVIDVENWRMDKSRTLRRIVSLIEWNSSISSTEYVQVQVRPGRLQGFE